MSVNATAKVQPADGAVGLNLAYLPILQRYGGRRGRQALALLAAGQMLWPVAKYLNTKARRSEDFTITVPGIDDVYPDLHEWVLERMPESERKAMIATTIHQLAVYDSPGPGFDAPEEKKARVRLRYDGSRQQSVTIDGHKVTVQVEREQVPERVSLPDNWRQYMERITFTAKTAVGRDAIVGMIDGLLAEKYGKPGPPALFIPSRYGDGWMRRGDLPPRTLESVVLKAGQLERLVADLEQFFAEEADYAKTSQPWHRGYIFHGAPGTGKTSLARALANEFGLTTYYLPLGDIDKDTNLMSLVASIQPRSVLLLEDVDVYHAATARDEQKDKVSIAAMLNSVDGIWTPHGLVTIMTTNNREELDDALTRAGRIDIDEEFTLLDEDQAVRLAEQFEVEPDADVLSCVGKSPSDLIEKLRRRRRKDDS